MQAAVQYTTIFLADMSVHYVTDRHTAIKGSGGANSMRLDFTVHGGLKEEPEKAVLDLSDETLWYTRVKQYFEIFEPIVYLEIVILHKKNLLLKKDTNDVLIERDKSYTLTEEDKDDPFVKNDEELALFRNIRLSIAHTTGYADTVEPIDHPTPVAASHTHTSRRTVYLSGMDAVFVHPLPVTTEAFTFCVGTAHPCTGLFCFVSLA
jgi:hypothetical protein